MKNTSIIFLISTVIFWAIGSYLLYQNGENNSDIIITAVIIIAGFRLKTKKKNSY